MKLPLVLLRRSPSLITGRPGALRRITAMAAQVVETESPKPRSRIASSVHDVSEEKPPFGARQVYNSTVFDNARLNGRMRHRFLTEDQDVWSQNAWDHVPPPDDQDEIIAAALAKQKAAPVPEEEKTKYNEKPAKHWYAKISIYSRGLLPINPAPGTISIKRMRGISSEIANGAST